MYKQKIQPNLGVVGESDDCLVYVRNIFGVDAKYPTAIANWNASTALNHPDEQPPTNVSVPCYFKYLIDGVDEGHVICSVNGSKFYSVSAQGDKVFDSIQDVIDFIAVEGSEMAYLGWSEEIESTPVVEVVTTPAPAATPVAAATSSAQTISLPATTGPWHLYKVGSAYNPAIPADVLGLLEPSQFGGLTYAIDQNLGNGVYVITTQDFGKGAIWTNGSDVTIS